MWHGGAHGEPELLASCYRSSLKVAMENGVRSIAFPSISTGVYSYPVSKAAETAVDAVSSFLSEEPDAFDEVLWALFDERTKSYYDAALSALEEKVRLGM